MTKEEQRIEEVLIKLRECIKKNRITIGDRSKNLNFLRQYHVDSKDRLKMLNELTTKNFCQEILERQKTGDEYDEHIYVFGLTKCLKERLTGKNRDVRIYIKFQFIQMKNNEDATLLISFHEEEKPLTFMFK